MWLSKVEVKKFWMELDQIFKIIKIMQISQEYMNM